MQTKKILLLYIAIMCSCLSLSAAHIIGGHMSYRTISVGIDQTELEIVLTVYRDAFSGGANFDTNLDIGVYVYDGIGWGLFDVLEGIPQTEVLIHQTTNSPFVITNGLSQFESTKYIGQITVPHDVLGDLLFVYQRCCRVPNLNNIVTPEETGFAMQLLITKEALLLENNSPFLYDAPPSIASLASSYESELPISESDGDSLIYNLCAPHIAGGPQGAVGGDPEACDGVMPRAESCLPPFDKVQYNTGFNSINPLGFDQTFDIHPETGIISGSFDLFGLFNYGVCVDEVRENTLLSKLYIDHVLSIDALQLTSIIRTRPYYDKNQNGVQDMDEQFLDHIGLELDPTQLQIKKDGTTEFNVLLGDFSILPIENWSFTTSNTISVTQFGSYYDLNLGLFPNTEIQQFDLGLHNTRAICNSTMEIHVEFANSGTLVSEGALVLYHDQRLVFSNMLNGSLEPQMITEDSITWYITEKDIGEMGTLEILMNTPDESNTGEVVALRTKFFDTDNACIGEYTTDEIILCAFDPNDKQVSPNNRTAENKTEIGTELHYTVRFENEGNFVAGRVIIRDTLSPLLNTSTLRIIGSSHDMVYALVGNVAEFTFADIALLPDETGYVKFRISHIDNIEESAIIDNQASIIFDSNAPIITNTIRNTMVSDITSTQGNLISKYSFSVFPSPTKDRLNIKNHNFEDDWNYSLHDLDGRQVLFNSCSAKKCIEEFDINSGVYLLRIYNAKSSELLHVEKIVVIE